MKAALSLQFARETLPDKKFVMDADTHKLAELVKLAGLQKALKDDLDRDGDFAANWAIVSAWDESARYENKDSITVHTFMDGLSNDRNGVFGWVKRHW